MMSPVIFYINRAIILRILIICLRVLFCNSRIPLFTFFYPGVIKQISFLRDAGGYTDLYDMRIIACLIYKLKILHTL